MQVVPGDILPVPGSMSILHVNSGRAILWDCNSSSEPTYLRKFFRKMMNVKLQTICGFQKWRCVNANENINSDVDRCNSGISISFHGLLLAICVFVDIEMT